MGNHIVNLYLTKGDKKMHRCYRNTIGSSFEVMFDQYFFAIPKSVGEVL